MCKTTHLLRQNKRKFIPTQVKAIDRLSSVLCALQVQRNRISKYNTLIEQIDNGEVRDTVLNVCALRDNATLLHDRHVTIYKFILDYYASQLSGMLEGVIEHTAGSPIDRCTSVPFIQTLTKTA